MIRTKSYILREIARLKKHKIKLTDELKMLKAYDQMMPELKKSIILVTKEIDAITIKIETLYWCANTSEKQLPKLKSNKKKKKLNKKSNINQEIKKE